MTEEVVTTCQLNTSPCEYISRHDHKQSSNITTSLNRKCLKLELNDKKVELTLFATRSAAFQLVVEFQAITKYVFDRKQHKTLIFLHFTASFSADSGFRQQP